MLTWQVLGAPERDNALFVRIDTGRSHHRLLFDCGDSLSDLPAAETRGVDHLLFSHLHLDHVGGFDSFFRHTHPREAPVEVWGPPETVAIMGHRFQGFMWNLQPRREGTWFVHDVYEDRVESVRFSSSDRLRNAHPAGVRPFNGVLINTPVFTVRAFHMDHLTPSLAYLVEEKPRLNINTAELAARGLPGGPWLQRLKDEALGDEAKLELQGTSYRLGDLREGLLECSPGASVAYLTDFLLDERAMERLSHALKGCTTIVCEAQFQHADVGLALKTHHMTTVQAATLAERAGAGELVLIHLSERYRPREWGRGLGEARAVFPNTHFPPHWRIPLPPGA